MQAILRWILFQFFCKSYSHPHTLYEAGSLVVSAQGTDWVDDFIHLLERHAVHQRIEVIEVLLQLSVIHEVGFCVGFVEHGQDGVSVSEVRWVGVKVGFQDRVKI